MPASTFHLQNAKTALSLAMRRDRNRATYLTMAASQLRKAIGAANREGNRRLSGKCLFALARCPAL